LKGEKMSKELVKDRVIKYFICGRVRGHSNRNFHGRDHALSLKLEPSSLTL